MLPLVESFIRVVASATRTSPATEDVAVIDTGWAFCNGAVDSAGFAAIGAIDDSNGALAVPGSGDFDALEAAYEDFLTALAGTMSDNHEWTEVKMVRADSGHPTPNLPVATYDIGIPGVGTDGMPPQVAASVTLQVGRRRSWGRFYVPGIRKTNTTDNGRFTDALCDSLEAAYVTLAGAAAGSHWFPLVFTAGSPTPGTGHTINGVRCDNVADVVRRRRWDAATYRAVDSIPP
jgi:hypothetical protein